MPESELPSDSSVAEPAWDTLPLAAACRCGHQRAGIQLADPLSAMSNIFMAGSDLVRWELTSLGARGPYQLTMRHAQGSIVEYFRSMTAALVREGELEDLLMAARGAGPDRTEVAL